MWRPSSYGVGPRHWYVTRGDAPVEVLSDGHGRYRRFGSYETAKRVADAKNKES